MTWLRSFQVVAGLLVAGGLWLAAGRCGELPAVTVHAAGMARADAAATPAAAGTLDWRTLDRRELAQWRGPYWLRWNFDLPASAPDRERVLRLSLGAASEVYWDGRLLGSTGGVGESADEEVPGRMDWTLPLPPGGAGEGRHQLLVRASSHHAGFTPYLAEVRFLVGPPDALYARIYARWLVAALVCGAMAVAGLYFLVARRRAHGGGRAGEGWLLLLGLVGLLLPLVEAWRPLLGYRYDLHPVRLNLLLGLHACAAALLPVYLAARFRRPWSPWGAAAFALLLLGIVFAMPGFDGRNLALNLSGLTAGLGIVLSVRGEDRGDAVPVAVLLASALLLLVAAPAVFLDGLYFIALAVLMVFLLLGHAAHLAALGEQNVRLQAQRAGLSNQLLRRSIHPHWLMNTLTSLQELIEQAPAHASRMVALLAEEFAHLRAISERPSILLREEIALCRAHLEIVGLAHDCRIGFEVDGDVEGIELPPGLLHTLVENGLTHAGAAACAAAPFLLEVRREGGRVHLRLHGALGKRRTVGDGTGARFIRSSLETAWPGRWRFSQEAGGGRWQSRIELPCAS